jgi:hypothetical protein
MSSARDIHIRMARHVQQHLNITTGREPMKTLLGLTVVLCLSSACGESDNPEVARTGLAHRAGAAGSDTSAAAGHAAPPTAAGKVAACVSLANCCEQLSDARDRVSCGDYAASANATTCDDGARKFCPSSEPAPDAPPSVCTTLASCCDAMTTASDQVACDKMVATGNAVSCQDGANIFCPGNGSDQPSGVDACTVLSRCCLAYDAEPKADQGLTRAPDCAQIALDGAVGACAEAAVDFCH